MPIREFKCTKEHVTEKILFGADDNKTTIPCEHNCAPHPGYEACRYPAVRVDISRPGAPILRAGCGGFYKPSLV